MSSVISSKSSSTPTRLVTPTPPPHFDAVIRTDTIEPPLEPGQRKKRKSWVFICTIYPEWSTTHRTNAIKHVNSRHLLPAFPNSSQSTISTPASTPGLQRDIPSMFTPTINTNGLRNAFNAQAYREALIGLLTRRRMPFSAVEWSEMTDLALACNPAIKDLLIDKRRTAVRYIASNYRLYREQLKGWLSAASSPIHIASDLWTSPNRHSLLAISAQWVDGDYKLQNALLGLRECQHSHSGEHQARLILDVLEDFDICSNIGWHTGDNATSNNSTLKVLEKQLLDEHSVRRYITFMRSNTANKSLYLDLFQCRAASYPLYRPYYQPPPLQAFLLASSKEALKAALLAAAEVSGEELLAQFSDVLTSEQRRIVALELNVHEVIDSLPSNRKRKARRGSQSSQGSILEELSGIQNIPALRKLHNLAVWLRKSTLHMDAWRDSVGIQLGIDNQTR